MSRCLNVRDHSGRAVGLACDSDLTGIISDLLQLIPICLSLILIVSYLIIIRGLDRQVRAARPHFLVRMSQNTVPRTIIPVADIPLSSGIVSGFAAVIASALVASGVADLDRICDREDPHCVFCERVGLVGLLLTAHIKFPGDH